MNSKPVAKLRRSDVAGERGFLGLLRGAPRIAVLVGAVASVGLMLWAGHRNPSLLLLVLFALWVLSPFMALALVDVASKSWSVASRATLHSVTLVITLVSLAMYGDVHLRPPKPNAFVFIVVPPASLMIIVMVGAMAALISGRLFQSRLARGLFKGFAILALLSVLGVGALLGALWVEHRTELTLPAPSGLFAVGRAIHDWADDVKLDTLAPVPGTKRELLVWIWYPATPGKSIAVDDYVPPQLQARGVPPGSPIFRFLTRDPSKVHSHSIRNADVSSQQRAYPVVVMRTGASSRRAYLLDVG